MDVSPDKQNIESLFSNKTYYIDFYQRQYKWNEVPVHRLLDDIFYKFEIEYKTHSDKDIELEQLIDKYSWYYLNTYVTNTIEGRLYIVDGQQRLTTLTLILIKLKNKANEYSSPIEDWISSKIVGLSGYKKEFWMNHEHHKETMQGLFDNKSLNDIDTSSGITAQNMVKNYTVISRWIEEKLNNIKKFEHFVFYFMKRLVLVNLNVEQTDVPMVFEVINDRGVKLKPYEILKGKLLGQVSKEELEHNDLNTLWDKKVDVINAYGEDEVDDFFMYYLRAKYVDKVSESKKIDRKNYHRAIFDSPVDLMLSHNPSGVKEFLKFSFTYYANLYEKISGYYHEPNADNIHIYYNGLNDMDHQFMLIMSACKVNDPMEEEKIKKVSKEVDRLYTMLQLQRSYDSNDFNAAMYDISKSIRDEDDLSKITQVFSDKLLELLGKSRGSLVAKSFDYLYFKDAGNELNKRFKRYFFARIEQFIADETRMNMKHSLYDLVANTGSVNGFHIEHILSYNNENLALFNNDEETFEYERNRLGALLLLKGRDNISSSNETYEQKLKSYANTLYWNETLREDTYKSKLDFTSMIRKY
ncbi:DUF262 domain-containing protein, partial [Terribacillus saccharophilus]|uniref:DUF262 domain-containing protein n=1 Tax=Terribacillus saccharophilus TaxID=361277 RepID=UPI002DD2A3A0|nr:DUF262 domain-containing protein [Terribacillus saccharophilus]